MPLMTTTELLSACRQRCSCVSSTFASRFFLLGFLLLFSSQVFSQPQSKDSSDVVASPQVQQELRAVKPLDFVEEKEPARARAQHLATVPGEETVVVSQSRSPLDLLIEFLGLSNKGGASTSKPKGESSKVVVAQEISPHVRIAAKITQRYRVSPERALAIVSYAHQESAKHGLDPMLVLSVIATESSFDASARSHAGAVGLMQAIPRYHQDSLKRSGVSASDLYHPRKNIQVGADILSKYVNLSGGDVASALQRYNGSAKDKSRKYSNKVFRIMNWLSSP